MDKFVWFTLLLTERLVRTYVGFANLHIGLSYLHKTIFGEIANGKDRGVLLNTP